MVVDCSLLVNVRIEDRVINLMVNYDHSLYLQLLDKQLNDQHCLLMFLDQYYSMMNLNSHWVLMSPLLYFHHRFVEIYLTFHDVLNKNKKNIYIINRLID